MTGGSSPPAPPAPSKGDAAGARPRAAKIRRILRRTFLGLTALGATLAVLAALAYKNVLPGGPWLVDNAEDVRVWWREGVYAREASSIPAGTVLFIGSSSVESFPLAVYFHGAPWLNRGLAVETALDLSRRLERTVPVAPPSGVVVWTGMNDLRAEAAPVEVIAERVGVVLDMLARRYPGVPVVLLEITPQCDSLPEHLDRLHDTNRRLAEAARARGVTFVRTDRPPLSTPEGQLSPAMAARDRKHLNLAGYGVLVKWIREEGGPAVAALSAP